MPRTINEVGTLEVKSKKNVIFYERKLKNIFFNNMLCTIEFEKLSEEGISLESISIPYEEFSKKAEDSIWDLIDELIEIKE
ncbi:hypothetical protein [Enterococcus gallinarum]|uniref:hypothetical protein n=1 Tax=Enterococcus gallinarum TaxID=1353 RepID=UPI000BBBB687|nr:hypothetical protein [Enterococcus gallinarum]PCD91513.1 hypothetical protein CKY18_15205 [Enterococcus gallinarum]